jgi:hypothetical protein
VETAQRILREKTGLSAEFTLSGAGYIRIFKDNELESFTHFTLLRANAISYDIVQEDHSGENMWIKDPDFGSKEMIPSMLDLAHMLENHREMFLVDLRYEIKS